MPAGWSCSTRPSPPLVQYRFALDLQRFTASALSGLGATHAPAREALLLELSSLIKRMPTVVGSSLAADGTPLADAATKEWLQREVLAKPIAASRRPPSLPLLPRDIEAPPEGPRSLGGRSPDSRTAPGPYCRRHDGSRTLRRAAAARAAVRPGGTDLHRPRPLRGARRRMYVPCSRCLGTDTRRRLPRGIPHLHHPGERFTKRSGRRFLDPLSSSRPARPRCRLARSTLTLRQPSWTSSTWRRAHEAPITQGDSHR